MTRTIDIAEVESVLESTIKLFVCPFCDEVMKEAAQAQCDHVFCQRCLKKLVICPECDMKIARRGLKIRNDIQQLFEMIQYLSSTFKMEVTSNVPVTVSTRLLKFGESEEDAFDKLKDKLHLSPDPYNFIASQAEYPLKRKKKNNKTYEGRKRKKAPVQNQVEFKFKKLMAQQPVSVNEYSATEAFDKIQNKSEQVDLTSSNLSGSKSETNLSEYLVPPNDSFNDVVEVMEIEISSQENNQDFVVYVGSDLNDTNKRVEHRIPELEVEDETLGTRISILSEGLNNTIKSKTCADQNDKPLNLSLPIGARKNNQSILAFKSALQFVKLDIVLDLSLSSLAKEKTEEASNVSPNPNHTTVVKLSKGNQESLDEDVSLACAKQNHSKCEVKNGQGKEIENEFLGSFYSDKIELLKPIQPKPLTQIPTEIAKLETGTIMKSMSGYESERESMNQRRFVENESFARVTKANQKRTRVQSVSNSDHLLSTDHTQFDSKLPVQVITNTYILHASRLPEDNSITVAKMPLTITKSNSDLFPSLELEEHEVPFDTFYIGNESNNNQFAEGNSKVALQPFAQKFQQSEKKIASNIASPAVNDIFRNLPNVRLNDEIEVLGSSKQNLDMKFVFCPTRLSRIQLGKLQKLSSICGGRIVKNYSDEVSHLILNLEMERVPQTMKYLFAIAGQKWVRRISISHKHVMKSRSIGIVLRDRTKIVVFDWVEECLKEGRVVPEDRFETSNFPQCDSGVRKSRLANSLLFKDFSFHIAGHMRSTGTSTTDCKKLLVELGGTIISNPDDYYENEESLIIIGDPLDANVDCQKWFELNGWLTISWEWILDCILTYTLVPFSQSHLLTRVDGNKLRQAQIPVPLLAALEM